MKPEARWDGVPEGWARETVAVSSCLFAISTGVALA